MGAGLALQFRQRFPKDYAHYRDFCQRKILRIGRVVIHNGFVFFPTKEHWRRPSSLTYIEVGLENLASQLRRRTDIRTLAVPKLGCGLGQLSWDEVRPLLEMFALDLDTIGIDVIQY